LMANASSAIRPASCKVAFSPPCKTIAFVEGKLLTLDGTLLATATASERLLEAAKALRT
jgi:hypothetical protein